MSRAASSLYLSTLVVAWSLTTISSSYAVPPEPKNLITQRKEFGAVDRRDVPLEVAYTLTNNAGKDLHLRDVRTSCGCISIKNKPKVVKAHGNAEVIMTVNTRAIQGKTNQMALIYTDDPEIGYGLEITGVVNAVWVEPLEIDLGSVPKGAPVSRDVYVYETGKPATELVRATSNKAAVQVQHFEVDTDKESRKRGIRGVRWIRLDVNTAELDAGAFHASVVVETNEKEFPKFEIPITVHVQGEARIEPRVVFFGRVATGQNITRSCQINFASLISPAGKLEFQSDHPQAIQTNWEPGKGGASSGSLQLTLSPAAGAKSGLIKGNIVALLDGKTILSIPYTGFIASK